MLKKKRKNPPIQFDTEEFKQDHPPVRFTVPKRLSVREHLEYAAIVSFSDFGSKDWISKRWEAAQVLIDEWECPALPDPKVLDLDKRDLDPNIPRIISFVATGVWVHVQRQDELEKK